MEELARLQARISSLDDLRGLFHAMRSLAASRLQEAQGSLAGIRRYSGVIERSIGQAVALIDRRGPPPDTSPPAAPGMIIAICSEHGFAGAFNEHVLTAVKTQMSDGMQLGLVGRHGEPRAREIGLDPQWIEAMATHVDGVLAVARSIAVRLEQASTVFLVFARYSRGGRYEVETRRLVPPDLPPSAAASGGPPPLHHLPPERLLRRLVGEYLLAEITLAAMESLASESAARLQVMDAADRNIDDKLVDLARSERALRQEAITSELLDIVTGAEAVLG